MTTINAYLNFNGGCREAMNFYKECFGGELTMMPVEGSPMENQCPAALKHFILHAMLQNDSLVLLASDMSGPDGYQKGNNIALSVNCSSEEEIDGFFAKLAEGGQIVDNLKVQFWGAKFGAVKDRFGINWTLNYQLPNK